MFSRKAKYFMELAKNNSLNDAANSIYITPSAMSQGLSSFEKNMGHKLLEKKSKLQLSKKGIELFDLVKPHYDAINIILNEFKKAAHTHPATILIDSFPYAQLTDIYHNKNIRINLECRHSRNIATDLESGCYLAVISPLNIELKNTNISKIDLQEEKIGVLIHKDIVDCNLEIKEIMSNTNLIHTTSSLENSIMKKLISRLRLNGINSTAISANEIEVLYMLKEKIGYSIVSECFFIKNRDIMKDLYFTREPFNLTLNRKMYFPEENRTTLQLILSI